MTTFHSRGFGRASRRSFCSPQKTRSQRMLRATNARRTSDCLLTSRTRHARWQSGEASWCLPMSGNFVLLRLRRGNDALLGFGDRMRRADLAVFQNKDIAAPVDLVVGEAREPYPEGHQIA